MSRTRRNLVEDAILAPNYDSSQYVEEYLKPHMRRFEKTVSLLGEIASPEMNLIDVGSYGSLVPALQVILGLKRISVTEPHQQDKSRSEDQCLPNARNGGKYHFHVDRFDIESTFPYPAGMFDIVLFTEVLEHIALDPVHTLSEINRITKVGGWMLLSTPNCASAKSVLKILRGGNPNFYPVYNKQPSRDRHNREYTAWEVKELLRLTGYEVIVFEAIDVYDEKQRLPLMLINLTLRLAHVCSCGLIKSRDRGDTIFALGKKISAPTERYPSFLYV